MSLFKGKTTVNRADKISDFTVATAEYGSTVPEILGTTRTGGNVIYYDDFTAHEHKETQRAGKGGGSKTVTITYTYTAALIFALCEGPIKGMGKVWIDKEIHTYPSDKIGLTLYYGTETQEPWPYVVGKHPEKALPYTGLAYMAGVIDLGNNASLPNFNFEVKGKLTETGDGVDVNPADYILYILNKIGMGDVAIEGIDNYRRYCKAADLLISTPSDDTTARSAREIINEIATLTNAYIFWSNNQFKIVPLADRPVGNWEPNKTIIYDLTPDDFLEQNGACVTYQRKDSSEVYNRFTVEFLNRANGYEKESVSYEDTEDIQLYGLRQASTTKAHYVYTKKRAVYLAEELARKNKYERNKYTFKLDWAFCRLEVGDLVTLTDPSIGLEKQVAIIDSVTEDKSGLLTYTAISKAGENFSEAVYSVHDTERPFIDFSPEPGDVDAPAIFQPPTELTSNGNELWIGAKGMSPNWGGCNVWISDNNENYLLAGKITSSARLGTLAAPITKDSDKLEAAVNGTLLSGSALDAERANTLCWVDGECLSYTKATLLQNGNYELSGLVRGQYNTAAAAHGQGAKFARCDETLLKTPLKKEDVGKKLWIKFTSYNIFGAQEQSLADVDAYEYTVMAYYIPPVLNLSAHNRYRELQDGVSRYDIVVDWSPPEFANYLEGNIWYKTSGGQGDALTFKEGIAGDRQGYNGQWIFGGSGYSQVVIPQAIVGDTYLIACTTKDQYGESNSPDMAPQTEILVALKTTAPNTPNNFGITFGEAAILSWDEVTNADVVFYEVRYDTNPGSEDIMLLARTNGTSMTVTLNDRKGTLYLYAKSAIGKYSSPAILEYNKPTPPKPAPPTLGAKLGAIAISTSSIPSGCKGMNIYIDDGTVVYTNNRVYTYSCPAGVYFVKIAYVDIFGEGPHSEENSCTIKVKVDNELLEKESIMMENLTDEAKKAIEDSSIDKINIAVKGILNTGCALTMQDDGTLALVASDGSKLTGMFAGADGILRLMGQYIHITGDTVFDDNVIVSKMLSAGCIDTEKLASQAISLSGALSVIGGAVKLSEEGLRLTANDNSYTLFNGDGINYVDKNGVVYAQVKKMIIGKAYDSQYIRFSAPWDSIPSVITVPMSIQTNDINYQASTTTIVCEATEVTQNGFRVNNYLKLAGGSYAVINANRTETLSLGGLASMSQYGYGRYTYYYTMAIYSDCLSITIPSTANYLEVSLNISSVNKVRIVYGDSESSWIESVSTGYPGANSGYTGADNSTWYVKVELIIGGSIIATASYSTTSGNYTVNTILSASFTAGPTSAYIRVTYTGNFYTNDHGSWSTVYNGWSYIAKAVYQGSKITMPYYKYSASESKIARGYAMFLVTDGSTNTYTIE